jgi:hypothetical protein
VDGLKLLLCVVHNLTGKVPLLELGHHASVAQLLDVVNLRHPVHHLLTPELPGGEAEGSGHLHVKHVQPVASAVDLGEKMTVAVLDSEHPLGQSPPSSHPRLAGRG